VPTSTASATPLPAWPTSVTNGGFEVGYTQRAWTESSSLFSSLIRTAYVRFLPSHGTYYAWLGGGNSETSVLATSLTIPAEATYLHMHTFVYSAETVCGNDVTSVTLNNVVVATIPRVTRRIRLSVTYRFRLMSPHYVDSRGSHSKSKL
jgi:hypothetical protein